MVRVERVRSSFPADILPPVPGSFLPFTVFPVTQMSEVMVLLFTGCLQATLWSEPSICVIALSRSRELSWGKCEPGFICLVTVDWRDKAHIC